MLSSCGKGDGLSQAPQLGDRTETAPGSSLPLRHVAPLWSASRGLHFIHISTSNSGEGNGNPLQYSCLGNPRQCCRKEDPFRGPKPGCCLILGNELSEETHLLTKPEILLGKGTQVESRRVREPRRTALSQGLQSWVLWMGLVSGLSVANHSDSESFLVVHALFNQPRQREGFWEVVGHVGSPFDLSGCWWLISSVFLSRTSCHKTTHTHGCVVPGQGGGLQSVCFP